MVQFSFACMLRVVAMLGRSDVSQSCIQLSSWVRCSPCLPAIVFNGSLNGQLVCCEWKAGLSAKAHILTAATALLGTQHHTLPHAIARPSTHPKLKTHGCWAVGGGVCSSSYFSKQKGLRAQKQEKSPPPPTIPAPWIFGSRWVLGLGPRCGGGGGQGALLSPHAYRIGN